MEETLTLLERTAFLKSVPMFARIPTESLAELAARAREMHFDAGDVIFREGEPNRGHFLVVEGMVEIRRGQALDSMRQGGQGFGEPALREGEGHHFTAVAAQHTHVLNVSNEVLLDSILDFPELGLSLVRIQAIRISELAQRVDDLEVQVAHLHRTLSQAGVEIPPLPAVEDRRD